jgi:hypothetical protein
MHPRALSAHLAAHRREVAREVSGRLAASRGLRTAVTSCASLFGRFEAAAARVRVGTRCAFILQTAGVHRFRFRFRFRVEDLGTNVPLHVLCRGDADQSENNQTDLHLFVIL